MSDICDNGNSVGIGRVPPCNKLAIHWIQSPSHPPIKLCDEHGKMALAAGLITEPMIGEEEFARREAKRLEKT